MKRDLQGLEIGRRELRQLIGISVKHIRAPFTARVLQLSLWYFAVDYIAMTLLGAVLQFYLLTDVLPFQARLLLSLGLGILTAILHRRSWLRQSVTPSLRYLLDDVERFNSMIKAIYINDQIEAAGNSTVALENREKVIAALYLTRADLVRALKTERILRENKHFITDNPELFANNLSALTALQVSDQATEHGRLLNEALQIAVDTREEMMKLQDW